MRTHEEFSASKDKKRKKKKREGGRRRKSKERGTNPTRGTLLHCVLWRMIQTSYVSKRKRACGVEGCQGKREGARVDDGCRSAGIAGKGVYFGFLAASWRCPEKGPQFNESATSKLVKPMGEGGGVEAGSRKRGSVGCLLAPCLLTLSRDLRCPRQETCASCLFALT